MLDPFVDGRAGISESSGSAIGFAPERAAMLGAAARAFASVMKAPAYNTLKSELRSRCTCPHITNRTELFD